MVPPNPGESKGLPAANTEAGPSAETIPLTIFSNDDGLLTKSATLDAQGRLRVASAAFLSSGSYRTVPTAGVNDLAAVIAGLTTKEALAFGVAKNQGATGRVVTERARASGTAPDVVARTREHFVWPDGPGWLMIDVDLKDDELAAVLKQNLPASLAESPDALSIDQLREVLISAAPQLADAPMLGLPSASAHLYRSGTRECLHGLTGARFYVSVARANEIPDIGQRLHERLVLAGYGYAFTSKAGTTHVRSPIDVTVWSPERLDFIGGASCGDGVMQARGEPRRWNADRTPLLDLQSLPELTQNEREELKLLTRAIRDANAPNAKRKRAAWEADRREKGRTVDVRTGGDGVTTLGDEHAIEMSDGTWVTVDQILADPDRFHHETCADPLDPESNGHDRRIARIYTRDQRTGPAIHSFAHGGAVFLLQASAQADFVAHPTTSAFAAPPADTHRTDMGNAGRFARAFVGRLLYTSGRWQSWDGRRWASVDVVEVERLAKEVVRTMFDEAFAVSGDDRKKMLKWALDSESNPRIRAMLALARGELFVPAEKLDANPFLLAVLNGTLDLRTGALRSHDPADYITRLAPVAYDPNATCPRWIGFLRRVLGGDDELIRGVQRMVGYSLSGDTREQVLFFLHGSGSNGKSTFLETLRTMFGDYATQSSFSAFLARRSDGPRNDLARLRGARLVTANEAGDGKRLDETVVKSLTGSDTVTARFLYSEEFEFRPQLKLWLAANHKPTVRGDDPAIWRRLRLLPFTVTIPDEEKDPQLPAALLEELPGILAWAVDGCLSWQKDGLGLPAAVRDATAQYRSEMDTLAAFVHQRCIVAPESEVKSTELFEAYVVWCQAQNEIAETQRAFNERLAAHDPGRVRKTKSSGLMLWRGIELRTDDPVAAEPDTAEVNR